MRQAPTAKQQRLLDQIQEWEHTHACVPTQTELAKACGYRSTNAVRSHLRLLEKKGLIVRQPHKARTLKLAKRARRQPSKGAELGLGIPMVGMIAAGPLTEAVETSEDIVPVSPNLFRGTDLFALRVHGDSMKNAGILSGDISVINRQQEVANNEIAAIMLDGEATLKRIIKRDGEIVLRAANHDFEDMVVRQAEGSTLRILGRLVGIIRTEVH